MYLPRSFESPVLNIHVTTPCSRPRICCAYHAELLTRCSVSTSMKRRPHLSAPPDKCCLPICHIIVPNVKNRKQEVLDKDYSKILHSKSPVAYIPAEEKDKTQEAPQRKELHIPVYETVNVNETNSNNGEQNSKLLAVPLYVPESQPQSIPSQPVQQVEPQLFHQQPVPEPQVFYQQPATEPQVFHQKPATVPQMSDNLIENTMPTQTRVSDIRVTHSDSTYTTGPNTYYPADIPKSPQSEYHSMPPQGRLTVDYDRSSVSNLHPQMRLSKSYQPSFQEQEPYSFSRKSQHLSPEMAEYPYQNYEPSYEEEIPRRYRHTEYNISAFDERRPSRKSLMPDLPPKMRRATDFAYYEKPLKHLRNEDKKERRLSKHHRKSKKLEGIPEERSSNELKNHRRRSKVSKKDVEDIRKSHTEPRKSKQHRGSVRKVKSVDNRSISPSKQTQHRRKTTALNHLKTREYESYPSSSTETSRDEYSDSLKADNILESASKTVQTDFSRLSVPYLIPQVGYVPPVINAPPVFCTSQPQYINLEAPKKVDTRGDSQSESDIQQQAPRFSQMIQSPLYHSSGIRGSGFNPIYSTPTNAAQAVIMPNQPLYLPSNVLMAPPQQRSNIFDPQVQYIMSSPIYIPEVSKHKSTDCSDSKSKSTKGNENRRKTIGPALKTDHNDDTSTMDEKFLRKRRHTKHI